MTTCKNVRLCNSQPDVRYYCMVAWGRHQPYGDSFPRPKLAVRLLHHKDVVMASEHLQWLDQTIDSHREVSVGIGN
jgi:hypothetical protein